MQRESSAQGLDLTGSTGSAKVSPKEELQEEDPGEVQKASWSHKIEITRLRTKKFLSGHFVGRTYQETLLYLSVLSAMQYIYSTYVGENPLLDSIEVAMAVLFCFDWVLSFFTADHKIEFVTRFVIPIFLVALRFCDLPYFMLCIVFLFFSFL